MPKEQFDYTIFGQKFEAPKLEAGLYIVSTPIGNLRDITLRALQTLAAADAIACEDTRNSRVLLDHYGIRRPLIACHEHNEEQCAAKLGDMIDAGQSVALVSDAGTPAISDPGSRVVSRLLQTGKRVIPIPGACAALAGLVGSGLPTENFSFVGFLPKKAQAQTKALEDIKANGDTQTLIFYESPRRILETLGRMKLVFGGLANCCVARELTKLHETFLRGSIDEIITQIEAGAIMKGEAVIFLQPPVQSHNWDDAAIDELLIGLMADKSASKAASEAAKKTGQEKQKLFDRISQLRSTDE